MKYLVALLLLSAACSKNDNCDKAPVCINEKIEIFKSNAGCDDSKVDEFNFQAGTVYVFDNMFCCCDYTSEVLDAQCKSIGFLGGLIGNTKINGEDFSNAKYIRTIWEK